VQIQVILSLVAILGAACVALLVDYFRNKNQQLREAMVEMKVRQIEKERQLLTPAPAFVATLPAARVVQPAEPPAELVLAHVNRADKTNVVTEKPLVRTIEDASGSDISSEQGMDFTSRRRRRRPAAEVAATDLNREDDMNSKKVFSDWLIQRAVARAQRKMAGETTTATESAPVELIQATAVAPAPALVAPVPEPTADPIDLTEPKHEQVVIEPPAIHGYTSKYEPVVIDEFLWQSLFESKTGPKSSTIVIASPAPVASDPEPVDLQPETPVRPNQGLQLIQSIQPTGEALNVPVGFHEARALDELKNSELPFSGLVISLGITQNDTRVAEELAQTVTAYLKTLLRESDFACRTGEDEYLLICPNLSGVAAHRHLSALSERLWDFQLRALGSFLMLFSLGGVDVQREPLAEAIASATERMSQTKRSRKAIVMLTPGQRRRKAV